MGQDGGTRGWARKTGWRMGQGTGHGTRQDRGQAGAQARGSSQTPWAARLGFVRPEASVQPPDPAPAGEPVAAATLCLGSPLRYPAVWLSCLIVAESPADGGREGQPSCGGRQPCGGRSHRLLKKGSDKRKMRVADWGQASWCPRGPPPGGRPQGRAEGQGRKACGHSGHRHHRPSEQGVRPHTPLGS